MASSTLHVAALTVDGEPVPGVVRGGVLVTARDSVEAWRVHIYTTRIASWTVGEDHDLEIQTREGERVFGRGLLRQSDGQGHLFIGTTDIRRKQQVPAAAG